MPLWGWILAAGAAYVVMKGATTAPHPSTAALTPAQIAAQNQSLLAANAALAAAQAPTSGYGAPGTTSSAIPPDWGPTGPMLGPQPASAPGAPSAAVAGVPLYDSGHYDVHTGAQIVVDAYGNPYLNAA
jgi:hypothetical protein